MKYIFILIVMLVVAVSFALLLVKFAKLVAEDACVSEKDDLCNSRTRLSCVLEDEGRNIGTYHIEAYVVDGKISFMEVVTDKMVTGIQKENNITDYYMKKRGLTKATAVILITLVVFLTEILFYGVAVGMI